MSGDTTGSETVDGLVLKPGQSIRPNVSTELVKELILTHFGYRVTRIKELNSYDDNNFFVEATHVQNDDQNKFVFKVLNSMDSKKPGHVEAENGCMVFLSDRGINCPTPKMSVHGTTFPLVAVPVQPDSENNLGSGSEILNTQNILRLLTFVDGKILHDVPINRKLIFEIGEYIAKLEILLKGYSHPALPNHQTIWLMSSVPDLKKFMYVIKDEPAKFNLIQSVLNSFVSRVEAAYPQLEKGLLHGDFNEQNIIVRANPEVPTEYKIHGLIDFGDIQVNYYIFEVAITLCYMMLESVNVGNIDPLEGSGYALAGYVKHKPLSQLEMELLRTCIASRLCQSLVMGAYTYSQNPGNEYLLTTAAPGWKLLNRLWNETTDESLMKLWCDIISKTDGKSG